MRKIYLFLLLALTYSTPYADYPIVKVPVTDNILCIEDKSTGFIREGDDWKRINFIESKILVKRLKKSKATGYCLDKHQDYLFFDVGDNMTLSSACYDVRPLGEEPAIIKGKHLGVLCDETWKKKESEGLALLYIDCRNTPFDPAMRLMPNGNFYRSDIRSVLEDDDEVFGKRRISVSVGKCSTL